MTVLIASKDLLVKLGAVPAQTIDMGGLKIPVVIVSGEFLCMTRESGEKMVWRMVSGCQTMS